MHDGQCVAIRLGDWKAVFLENRGMRLKYGANLSLNSAYLCCSICGADPFEKAQHNANT